MKEEKTNNSTPLDDDNQSKEGKKRISYVSKELKTMVEFVGKVYNQLGHTSFHSNKAIATLHGLSPDSIKLHLSSAQQYNLFEMKHGIGYKVTDHFQKLHLPKNDNEKRTAIIESLKHADTYQQLFKDYEYHVVPAEGVKNHFIRSFGMKDDVATKAAQVFLQNLKDYELLDSRGVLTSAMPSKPTVPVIDSEGDPKDDVVHEDTHNEGGDKKSQLPTLIAKNEYTGDTKYQDHVWIPIHLTKGETAVFAYPKDLTENDIKIVKHQLEGILLRISLENEEKNKGD